MGGGGGARERRSRRARRSLRDRSAPTPQSRLTTDRASFLACVGLSTAIAVVDVAARGSVLIGLLIVGPLLAAGLSSPRVAVAVGVYATGLAVLVAALDEPFLTSDHAILFLVVVSGSSAAAWLSAGRARREEALLQLSRVAEVAQRAILRAVPPRAGPVTLSARYLSASADALIGGDFYDVATTPYGVRAILGDVRGKGLDAVRLAAIMLRSFREQAYARPSLVELAGALDRSLGLELASEDFVTAVIVSFLNDGVDVLNCGHPPPLAVTSADHRWLMPSNLTTPFGLDPDLHVDRFPLDKGSRVLLYSDGLVESRSPTGEFFPLEQRGVALLRRRGLGDGLDALVDALVDHAGGHVDDDLALLLAEIRPSDGRLGSGGRRADAQFAPEGPRVGSARRRGPSGAVGGGGQA
jgi:sigma-B regulation protein RsbU (phosphoserine phosphatase)